MTELNREFKQYRRSQVAEMADWQEGFDMTDVSVSKADAEAGSPKLGDKIARNPANHADKWLVATAYFAVNFEPLSALAARSGNAWIATHENGRTLHFSTHDGWQVEQVIGPAAKGADRRTKGDQ